MTEQEIKKQLELKEKKPRVFEKVIKYPEKVARGESIAIIQLQYDYSCNLSCKHCDIERLRKNDGIRSLTIADIKNVFTQADELGLAHVTISGGEPSIFPDLYELVNAIDPQKFHIAIDTNCLVVDREMIFHWKEIGINRLQISMDSVLPKEHDELRKRNNLQEKVLKVIDYGINAGLDVMLATVVTKKRVKSQEFIDFLEFAKTKGVSTFVTFAKPSGAWEGNYDVMVSKEDIKYIDSLRGRYNVFSHVTPAYGFNFGCIAISKMVSLTKYGSILICPYLQAEIGNIFREPLKDILERGMREYKKYITYDTCPVAADKEFVKKYLENKVWGKELPVPIEGVFE